MKKLIKLLMLYILFGIVLAAVISLFGGFKSLMILKTMGAMSLSDYVMLFVYVVILWLPGCFGMLLSQWGYVRLPFFKSGVIIVIILFVILSFRTLRQK